METFCSILHRTGLHFSVKLSLMFAILCLNLHLPIMSSTITLAQASFISDLEGFTTVVFSLMSLLSNFSPPTVSFHTAAREILLNLKSDHIILLLKKKKKKSWSIQSVPPLTLWLYYYHSASYAIQPPWPPGSSSNPEAFYFLGAVDWLFLLPLMLYFQITQSLTSFHFYWHITSNSNSPSVYSLEFITIWRYIIMSFW